MPVWIDMTNIIRAVEGWPLVDCYIFPAGLGGKAPMVTGNSVSSSTVALTVLVDSRTLRKRTTCKKRQTSIPLPTPLVNSRSLRKRTLRKTTLRKRSGHRRILRRR